MALQSSFILRFGKVSVNSLWIVSITHLIMVNYPTHKNKQLITLIEKKDKDKRKIPNWRPISLINVDVKIGSKAIAMRLQKVLPKIIHHNQHAYVKGRTINDAVRTIDDILEYTERYGIKGKMLAVDFQKAFDSVNRKFLYSTLAAFNFGPTFIQWIHTFYQNITSSVLNNGFST